MARIAHYSGPFVAAAATLLVAMVAFAAPAHATDVSTAVQMCEDRGPDCVHHTDGAYTYINEYEINKRRPGWVAFLQCPCDGWWPNSGA